MDESAIIVVDPQSGIDAVILVTALYGAIERTRVLLATHFAQILVLSR
jgi:hypothetical protein